MIELHPVRIRDNICLHVHHAGRIIGMITLPESEWKEVSASCNVAYSVSLIKQAINLLPIELDEHGYCPYCGMHSEDKHMATCSQQPLLTARGNLFKVLHQLESRQTVVIKEK